MNTENAGTILLVSYYLQSLDPGCDHFTAAGDIEALADLRKLWLGFREA